FQFSVFNLQLRTSQTTSPDPPPFYANRCYRLRPLSSLIGRRPQLLPPCEGGEHSVGHSRAARLRDLPSSISYLPSSIRPPSPACAPPAWPRRALLPDAGWRRRSVRRAG